MDQPIVPQQLPPETPQPLAQPPAEPVAYPSVPMQSSAQEPPVTTMPMPQGQTTSASYTAQSMPPTRSRMAVILIVVVLVIGIAGYASAAWYFKLWPLGGGNPLSKEATLVQVFDKLRNMKSASYAATINAKMEPREADAKTFDEAVAMFDEETAAYKRDENRFRDLKTIQTALTQYHLQNNAYPAQLSTIQDIAKLDLSSFAYTPNDADYALKVTFESDAAVQAVNNVQLQIPTLDAAKPSTNKTVTLSSRDQSKTYYFYPTQTAPSWFTAYDAAPLMLARMSPDSSVTINVSGTSDKEKDASPDGRFQIGGDLNMGDLQVALDVEFIKKADTYYARINKMPSFFPAITTLKGKWIKITPDDITGYGDYSYLGGASYFTNQSNEQKKKTQDGIEQMQQFMTSLYDQKVLAVDYTAPDEIRDKQNFYVYPITINSANFADWYVKFTADMKAKYGDNAIFKPDPNTLAFMKKPVFQKYLDYIKANTKLSLVVDPRTGYPVDIVVSYRIVPPNATDDSSSMMDLFGSGSPTKLDDKQLKLNFKLSLSNIDQPVAIDAPTDTMSFEDVMLATTGMTKEQYRFQRQAQNITAIRSALMSYKAYTGIYPAALQDLTKKRSEVQKKVSWWSSVLQDLRQLISRTANAQVSIDFPTSFNGFADDSYLLQQPFLKTIPHDVYTGSAFGYKLTDTGYALTYTMTLPTRTKKTSSTSYYGTYQSINEVIKYANGVNTLNEKMVSVEAAEAVKKDSDGDKLPDVVETYLGSSNTSADSDGDGYNDYDEVTKGYDPMGPGKLNYDETWIDPNAVKPVPVYPTDTYSSGVHAELLAPVSSADHIRGDAKAKITLIEYSDFQGPFDQRFNDTLTQLLAAHKGNLRLVYRQFPLSQIHPLAEKAAEASECAGDQGKFWEAHDGLFQLNKDQKMTADSVAAIGKNLKLDQKKFNDCLDKGTDASKVSDDYKNGIDAGVMGTPGTFLNGKYIPGALPYDQVEKMLTADSVTKP